MLQFQIQAQRDVVYVSSRFDPVFSVAPLNAALPRARVNAPVGITMWSILFALFFSYFTR
eukprot:9470538-Pyramimonas_sp.AAC.1